MSNDILNTTEHRDDRLPKGAWLMTQKWEHLLFMHLPVSREVIKEFIPDGLELDTYHDKAWISIIPFQVNHMRLRSMPPIPFLHSYLELNVRTYVKRNGVKGIYFFSLDANQLLAVIGARIATIPYHYAKMKMNKKKGFFHYESIRKGKTKANFKGAYRPISEPYYPDKESLSSWLLERYYM
ncbi:YqjF family protein [Oceanobacillus damuensis]|uniref:YqjF family protein n=1 Tax=Oceanobacillus damuensis TaxID=937928 RepID=UPI000A05D70F|nr:DUF2071 domain-containing protein [Oceanobacillus damuensis]